MAKVVTCANGESILFDELLGLFNGGCTTKAGLDGPLNCIVPSGTQVNVGDYKLAAMTKYTEKLQYGSFALAKVPGTLADDAIHAVTSEGDFIHGCL